MPRSNHSRSSIGHCFRPKARLAAWVLLASACSGGSTSPDESTGARAAGTIYELERLNGDPLPYGHGGLGCCVYTSGRLRLGEGTYELAIAATNRNNRLEFTAVEWGKFQQDGVRLTFAFDSFAVAGLRADEAVIENGKLELLFGGEGHGSPDQFRGEFVKTSW